jgi:PAT family beta-lactamase induction signal transducer AmpG
VLALSIATVAAAPPAGPLFWIAIALIAIASATQDIAIDALTIRITPSKLLGLVNSARVTAYRVAMIAAGGGVAILADRIGWRSAFAVSAAVPIAIGLVLAFSLPAEQGARERQENPLRALGHWLARPGALGVLAFILLYRLGDSALTPMVKPFWIARGFSVTEVGNVTTTLGMICTIAGAIAGGAFVTRFGLFRSLWMLGLVQMLSNFAYAAIAGGAGSYRPAFYSAAVIETFCGGLGTAAFLSFLMAVCEKENAATEYAMISAVFGLSRTLAGAVSGFFAQDLGFPVYFALTAALAVPGLALLPVVRARTPDATRTA